MGDIIFEVLLELAMQGSANKKRSLWVRIPAIIALILFALLFVFIVIGIAGVIYSALLEEEYLISFLMVVVEMILIIGVYKYIKKFRELLR